MDPTVIAAGIGVGGTIVVGLAGLWSTKAAGDGAARASADSTLRTLEAAREERTWDRRARAYEQGIAALLYRRQQRRQLGERPGPPDEPSFGQPAPRGWFEAEGTLLAYAAPAVITALEAARQADDAARRALGQYWKPRPPAAAREDLERALAEADDKDSDLISAIREDLGTRPARARPGPGAAARPEPPAASGPGPGAAARGGEEPSPPASPGRER